MRFYKGRARPQVTVGYQRESYSCIHAVRPGRVYSRCIDTVDRLGGVHVDRTLRAYPMLLTPVDSMAQDMGGERNSGLR